MRLGPEGRVRAAFEASEFVRGVTREGLRLRHPEYDETQLAGLLASFAGEFHVGAEEAREAFRTHGMFNVIDSASGWNVDMILLRDRDFDQAEFARCKAMHLAPAPPSSKR